MNWGKEDDAFEPEAVRQYYEALNRRANDTGPNGQQRRCHTCGKPQGITAIAGCCCWFCGTTQK